MATAWQRRRNPDDVPTPVAVAVSDFCRRAGAPAAPAEVRDALALLGPEEDFRVRSLTDSEPAARPLGPHAVIDVLSGTPQELAAVRQGSGYYELARALVEERERTSAPQLPLPEPAAVPAPAPTPPPAAAQPSRLGQRKAPPPPTVQERIAPKKRPGSSVPPDATLELPPLQPGADRERLAPKGRYANLAPTRQTVEELFTPEAKALLSDLSAQHPDRFALTRALGESFSGKREGQPLRTDDVERALDHHDLLEPLQQKEREAVLGAFTEQRGATGRVSMALGLSVSELSRLVKALALQEEVEQVRERFRREALSPRNLGQRLDLLGRGKYLSDLGIRRRFDDQLKADLKKLLHQRADDADTPEELLEVIARREGTGAELLRRAIEKLGLLDELHTLSPGAEEPDHAT